MCDVVDVEAVTDAATTPTAAEGVVAQYYVHEFQHTDIVPREQAL